VPHLKGTIYGCRGTLHEEHRLGMFEVKELGRIFGSNRKKKKAAENYITRSFIICTLHQILLGRSNQG
jgi:hypothetical protein